MADLSLDQYLNQWKVNYFHIHVAPDELTPEYLINAQKTVDRTNQLLNAFGERRNITSGWRPVSVNKIVPGAALYSKHTRCLAVDISDPDGDLDEWCLDNQDVLTEIGLWLEHPAATKGWCHVQVVPPKSGNRVFYP